MGVEFRVDVTQAIAATKATPKQVGRAVGRFLQRGGNYTAGVMRKVIASKVGANRVSSNSTGQTAASVRVQLYAAAATVGPQPRATKWGTFDPVYLDQGTRPHEIRPRFAKALAFARSGSKVGIRGGQARSVFRFGGKSTVSDLVFAKGVRHPGTRPMRFVEETLNQVQDVLPKMLDQELAREVGQ